MAEEDDMAAFYADLQGGDDDEGDNAGGYKPDETADAAAANANANGGGGSSSSSA